MKKIVNITLITIVAGQLYGMNMGGFGSYNHPVYLQKIEEAREQGRQELLPPLEAAQSAASDAQQQVLSLTQQLLETQAQIVSLTAKNTELTTVLESREALIGQLQEMLGRPASARRGRSVERHNNK